MSNGLQETTVRVLKAMWRERWDEAGAQGILLHDATVMSAKWGAALDRLVTLRADLRDIGRAIEWAEDGATWAVGVMSEKLKAEHGALVTAHGETDHARG